MAEVYPIIIGVLWTLLTCAFGFMVLRLAHTIDRLETAVLALIVDVAALKERTGTHG